jgi:hypothetical protein
MSTFHCGSAATRRNSFDAGALRTDDDHRREDRLGEDLGKRSR